MVPLVLLAGLADWLFHLDVFVRLALLVALGGVALWVVFKLVLRPLIVRFADLDIALRIEQRWPGLNDRLASTIQFLRLNPARRPSWLAGLARGDHQAGDRGDAFDRFSRGHRLPPDRPRGAASPRRPWSSPCSSAWLTPRLPGSPCGGSSCPGAEIAGPSRPTWH